MSSTTFPPGDALIQGYQMQDLVVGPRVSKSGLSLPGTINTATTLFTVTGGAVLVTALAGLVTTAIGGTASNLSLGTVPSVGSAMGAGIGGPTAITSLAAGTWVSAPSTAGTPGGTLVAPGVPGSGSPVTNPYHGSVDVTLSAFTLTAVFVNGVQVGTTNATYTVPQHGTISITYSVAGTWVWAGSVALEVGPGAGTSVAKDTGFIVNPGTISWQVSALDAGVMTWYISYVPIDNRPGNPNGSGGLAQVS